MWGSPHSNKQYIITCLVLISTGSSVNKLSKFDTSTSEVRSGTNGGGLSCLETASQLVPSKNTWFLTWSAPSWPKRSSGSFSSKDKIISFVAGVVPLGAYRKSTSLCKILKEEFKAEARRSVQTFDKVFVLHLPHRQFQMVVYRISFHKIRHQVTSSQLLSHNQKSSTHGRSLFLVSI